MKIYMVSLLHRATINRGARTLAQRLNRTRPAESQTKTESVTCLL